MHLGKMRPEGMELFNSRKDVQDYSAQSRNVQFDSAYEQLFMEHQVAREQFSHFAPSYRRDAVWWVMSAKKEETRLRRLNLLISSSAQGQKVPAFRAKDTSAS